MLAVVDDLVATPGDRGGSGAMVGTVRAPVGPPGARLLDDLPPADVSMGAKVPLRRIFSDILKCRLLLSDLYPTSVGTATMIQIS